MRSVKKIKQPTHLSPQYNPRTYHRHTTMKKYTLFGFTVICAISAVFGQPTVKVEHLNPADPNWKFKTVMGPSKSDVAQRGATVTVAGDLFNPGCGSGSVLVDGTIPDDSLKVTHEACLANGNGGDIIIDLARVQPVAAVNTYSWHEYAADQGSRGPQVYTLFGGTDGREWTKIAEVDTRPNTTGTGWNGQYGVNITDTRGLLGNYRYIKLAVQSTKSPLQPNPTMANTLYSEIDVHTPATLAKAGDASVTGPKIKNIVIVYKTHFDIGYTALASQVIHRYRTTMMDQLLNVIGQYKARPNQQQFVWTVPGWTMEQILWPGQDPARKKQVEDAVRAGNLVAHALPFSMQSETAELEKTQMVAGMHFSTDIAHRYGLPLPRGAKATDVPDQIWELPTLLRHAGVNFMQIGVNDMTTPAKVPMLFWWQGPDGSRLLTMLNDRYGSPQSPPDDWPYSTWLYVHMTYDNQGPPSPETMQADLDYYQKRYPGAKVKVGQLSDFYDAFNRGEFSSVPVVHADMPDCWVYGFTSSPGGDNAIADGRPLQSAVEFLATLNSTWGIATFNPSQAIADAYEQSLLWSEHTWGLASQNHVHFHFVKDGDITRGEPQPVEGVAAVEASYKEHLDYAQNVGKILAKPCADELGALAAAVHVEGQRIVVFNPLPWQRDDVARVSGTWAAGAAVQSPDGTLTQCETNGTSLSFVARGVPSMGYRSYRVVNSTAASSAAQGCSADTGTHTIESPAYRVVFDPQHGRVTSIFDKRAGRELVDDSAPQGFGYFYQRFSGKDGDAYVDTYINPRYRGVPIFREIMGRGGNSLPADQPHVDDSPAGMNFTAQVTPIGVEAIMSGTLSASVPQTVRLAFRLYRDLPCMDITADLDNQGAKDGWPVACNFSFPLKIDAPQFRVGRIGSVVNPVTDFMENSSRNFYWCNPGVAVFNDTGGVCLTAIDSPVVSLGEPGMMKFKGSYVPTKSRVYFNIQNKIWHTNFCDWWSGAMHSRFRLWSFNHYDNATTLIEPGMDAKRPLLAAVANGPAGTLPATQAGVTVSRPGVMVTAFGNNPDGQGTLLRVWETAGVGGKLAVTLPAGARFTMVTPVDLRGQATGKTQAIQGGKLEFDLGACAPASFLLH